MERLGYDAIADRCRGERRSSPRVYVGNYLGSCGDVKRPASEDSIADRRVMKLLRNCL